MSLESALESFRTELSAPTNGIISVVDAMLDIGRHCDFRVDGAPTGFLLTLNTPEGNQTHEFRMRRSLLRAFLTRVAVVVSSTPEALPFKPYENEGQVTLPGEPGAVRYFYYVNRASTQALEVINARPSEVKPRRATRTPVPPTRTPVPPTHQSRT